MNTAAVLRCLSSQEKVGWPQRAVVIVVATVGGYTGAHAGRRLTPRVIRSIVSVAWL